MTSTLRLATILSSKEIALDTMVFIYQFQENPQYIRTTDRIFNQIASGDLKATTSAITLSELMILPYRERNKALAEQLHNRILSHPNLKVIPINIEIAEQAAKLRAELPLRLPDCIHLASAAEADCFITNYRRFKKVKHPKIVLLEDIID